MIKSRLVTKLTLVEIIFFLFLFFGRFFLATYVSVNYSQLSFYQEYKDRLVRVNSHLELLVNQKSNLADLSSWARQEGFNSLTNYQRYLEKQIIAQR